jgi:hypothetical protein
VLSEDFHNIYLDFDYILSIIDVKIDKVEGGTTVRHKWIESLTDEDLSFLKRFLLTSGSLKALAQDYGISYPTVRLRLDRLIEKVKIVEDQEIRSEFERQLRVLYAEGKIDLATLNQIMNAHRREIQR